MTDTIGEYEVRPPKIQAVLNNGTSDALGSMREMLAPDYDVATSTEGWYLLRAERVEGLLKRGTYVVKTVDRDRLIGPEVSVMAADAFERTYRRVTA